MKKLIVFLNILLILFLLSGCTNKDNDQEIKEKAVQEIEYLDNQIITMINKLNNIDSNEGIYDTINQTTNNIIDWDYLKNQIEILNSSWGIIILDLYKLNINNNNILSFSTLLDNCVISIKQEHKINTLINLSKLYNLIPKYLTDIPGEVSRQNIKQTKASIINGYTLVEQDKWADVAITIVDADNAFKNITNNIDYVKNNEYKVNKTYVLLKELQKSIPTKDKQVFYIKYKNVIESLDNMQP